MEKKSSHINLEIIYEASNDSIPTLLKDLTKDKSDPEVSRIDIANPELSFPRTYLELYGSPNRLIGRYASENGLRDDRFISLFQEGTTYTSTDPKIIEMALTANGSLWRLTSEYISFTSPGDSSEIKHHLTGIKLHELSDTKAWVVGLGQAWYLSNGLQDVQKMDWPGGIHTVVMGEDLYSFTKARDRIISMDRNGTVKFLQISATHSPFENLAGFWNDRYMTVENSTFRIYGPSGLEQEIFLQSIGLLENGDPFLSYTVDKSTFLVSNTIHQEWKLPQDYSNYILPIVCNKGDTFIGYHLGVFSEFHSDKKENGPIENIDDDGYKERIEPYRWKRGANRFYSVKDPHNVVVSVTGPGGVVLININIAQ